MKIGPWELGLLLIILLIVVVPVAIIVARGNTRKNANRTNVSERTFEQGKYSLAEQKLNPKFCRNCGKELIGVPELCMNCGARPMAGNSYCFSCGSSTNALAEICVKCGTRLVKAETSGIQVREEAGTSSKSRLAATLLAFFLGELGIHRFYAGKTGTAILMLVLTIIGYSTMILVIGFIPLTVVWIWNLIDLIIIVVGKFTDSQGNVIDKW